MAQPLNPDLNIFTSNRLEILAEQLAMIVREPLSSPVSTEIIVVQSRGMERWVSMELAGHNGICANSAFPFPNAFLQEMFYKLIPDLPDESPFDPVTMTFRIMKILPECIQLPGFESLKRYLADDTKGMRLFQISQKIADLFDQYLVFRPEMIFGWEKGKEVHWQANLWRKLSSGKEKMHRAWLRKALHEKIRKESREIENFPGRVSIFGISYLPPFYLETFVEMSRLTQVNLFLMNPCREYWADIVSDREIKKIRGKYAQFNGAAEELYLEKGNRLLSSMGTLGRNFFSMISGLDCRMYEQFEDQFGHNMLSEIQSDILQLKDRKGTVVTDFDTSIQIHSCHSPMREIEVLHDNLLAMFEEDPDLMPKDVIVMTPDIELYAPFVQAVFDAQTDEALRIPFTIADQSVRKESRVIDGFMSILDLKDSRLGAISVMALLESPGIKEKFGLADSDIEIAERWIKDTNIRWGIDAESRCKMGLPGFSENTWKAGIERLLLGYAMPGFDCKMFSGILPYDHIEGDEVKVLGKFLKFLDLVFTCIDSLDRVRTLSGWHTTLVEILEQFFALDEDSEREIQVLRHILDDLSKQENLSGFDKLIEIEVVRSYLGNLLKHEHFGTGFISSGVTFCAMLPMRSIPFKVICLVGMNTDAFPRESQTLGFDLMAKNPRIGDRSRRNDDKYLFLESLVSARKRFYISYVGQSIKDNSLVPPSVLVSELIDYIKEGFGLSEECVVTLHRLQAFSPEYYKADNKLFSYSRENFVAGRNIYDDHRKIPSLISAKLPEPTQEWKKLDIDNLCAFFGNPARFLLEKRLGIFLYETIPVSDEREKFSLDNLEKYLIGQDLVENRLSGSDLNDSLSLQKAMGQLPHGNVGDYVFNEMSVDAEAFVRKTKNHIKGEPFDDLDVDLDIAGFNLFGRLTDIHEHGLIQIRYANTKPKYLLNTWIYHLLLSELVEEKYPAKSFLICKDAAWEFAPATNSGDILKKLLELFWKGMSEPLHFFPGSSFEYARKMLIKNQAEQAALNFAQKKWVGSDFSRGESDDPYFELCFGKTDPLDKDFKKIAENVFAPLLDHCTEIIL